MKIFQIGDIPIPTEVTAGLRIFKENQDNPDKIRMVGLHSAILQEVYVDIFKLQYCYHEHG